MISGTLTTEKSIQIRRAPMDLPPTPPDSDQNSDAAEKPDSDPEYDLPPPTTIPTEVLEVDKKTPDGWLPRDSRLIRLTGVHPFNVEAPLSDLYNEGFLTSPELFYVRNHGPVPQVESEALDWEFSIEGMVEQPLKLTLRDLLEHYEQKTYPITLVCAGNRRKEQNVVRKTKGFSWGAAGVSTALFTGVSMGDVLRYAKPKRGARYVCMEGADKLPNGYYGTSVKLNWVLDPNRGMMLAHGMNGEPLRPDHGYPLRAVIPGQIGGRSVKWLKRIIVTAEPSDNWYHLWDNRVLPTMVSPEESANNENWWKDERYAIYDLSTNSAIAYPAHDETMSFSHDTIPKETYTVRGYAYGGGGRRITRVEVSLDKGRTWRLASVDYAEDRYREAGTRQLYGGTLDMEWRESCFCWCFWNLGISVSELDQADDIFVRAMDESMNVQPRDMYWSVLGMMNNPWFRVVIHHETNDGNKSLRFEHPTQPALIPGGWMERVKKGGGDLANGYWGERLGSEETTGQPIVEEKQVVMTKEGLKNTISIHDLRKHDKEDAPWFVVNGEVYDGTPFLKEHPGGAQSIISAAALDSTDEFMAIHSETAKAMMPDYHIGSLDEEGKAALAGGEASHADSDATPQPTFLDSRAWKKAILQSKTTVSWDTRIFTFKLEHDEQTLGLPTGQHLMIRLRDPVTREAIIRSYTPISETSQKGTMDVLVKIYFDTPQRKGGKMSLAMDSLPLGHFVDFKGPIGKFEYLGNGQCLVNQAERQVKKFLMICGGSGITPIYQVFRAVMQDKGDSTQCVVLDGNRLLEDILCKTNLDDFARDNAERCKLLYTLTQAPEDWEGLRGRIAAPLLKEHCERASFGAGDAMVLICGPEPLEKSVHEALLEIGWREEDMLFF
ncbi:Nitrate reductase [Hortaea werneckii]|nr:Nitrate reductase [Hortaea werneckii]KAI7346873.1 Nitrate reductase [Hortaea werneckii]